MKDKEQIYQEMKTMLEARSGIVFDEGGDMALRLRAVAFEIESLWSQLAWTKKQVFPQSATGDFLDLHAVERGLSRGVSTKAVGEMRFETSTKQHGTITIPAGVVCLNGAGTQFLTTSSGIIEGGSDFCVVSAQAKNPGSSGNAPAGTVRFMAAAPPGVVKCNNPDPFSGGESEENDTRLRERILKTYEKLPNGSNKAYYETAVAQMDGVASVCVLPKVRGLGTVDIIVASEDGIPSEFMLDRISGILNKEREICVDIKVMPPETVNVPVNAEIEVKGGYDDLAVAENVKNQLEKYFKGDMLGKNVLRAELGNIIFNVDGVKNYFISSPAEDIYLNEKQLPIAQSIVISRR